MADMEINGTILKVLKEYYTDNIEYVKIGNDTIEVTKGLIQGCSLSPIVFNIYLEKKLWNIGRTTTKEENKCLFSLNYADDKVIIAQDADDLDFILKRLNKA
jgi:Reverse transcriptase (RNA-dependent DNA polymerase).